MPRKQRQPLEMSKKGQFQITERAGFTLVEIMIVVGIITLLAALALDRQSEKKKRNSVRREGMCLATISARRQSIKSQPSRPKLTPSLPMLPATDFGPRLLHKTGIVPKFRFDGTQACQPVRPAGLQPAERNQNLSAGQSAK